MQVQNYFAFGHFNAEQTASLASSRSMHRTGVRRFLFKAKFWQTASGPNWLVKALQS